MLFVVVRCGCCSLFVVCIVFNIASCCLPVVACGLFTFYCIIYFLFFFGLLFVAD